MPASRWPRLETRRLWLVLAAAMIAFDGHLDIRAQNRPPAPRQSAVDLLDQYARGEYAAIDVLRKTGRIGATTSDLTHQGPAWVAAQGPGQEEHRRLVLAAAALDIARAGLDHEWLNASSVIEWTSAQLRRQKTPPPAERLWHLAAIALIEGAFDSDLLDAQLKRAVARFPNEPRFKLAKAELKEMDFWPTDGAQTWDHDGIRDRAARSASTALLPLLSEPALAPEVEVRAGYLDLRMDHPQQALDRFRLATASTDDAGVAYLAELFSGWADDRLKRPDTAIDAYRAALLAVPRAEAATWSLATDLYARDERPEADTLVEAALTAAPPVDPWRVYGYDDFRLWDRRMDALREAVR